MVEQSTADNEVLFLIGASSGWILDSGATCYICCDRNSFIELDENHVEAITVAYGEKVKAHGRGKNRATFLNGAGKTTSVLMADVLFVPSIGTNLNSVTKLTERGLRVHFSGSKCEIRSRDGRDQIATGSLNGRLYEMWIEEQLNVAVNASEKCIHEWHRVLGHRDLVVVKQTPSMVDGMKVGPCKSSCEQDCTACIVGKMSRTKFPKATVTKSTSVLDLVHSDVCGPMQTQTHQGKRYILSFIDDFSKYTTIYLLREKSEVFAKLKDFNQLMANQFGRRIKTFRSDRGGEYPSSEFNAFFNSNGIVAQHTPSYSPQQNVVAERKNRSLLEMARCMLADALLEKVFWGEAVETANFLQNRLPSRSVQGTPYELWFGK